MWMLQFFPKISHCANINFAPSPNKINVGPDTGGGIQNQTKCTIALKPSPFNQKFCATPKIYKKISCISKIVDFTAFFSKISH